ncbi:hypothetical protein T310_9062, partial [Rasamsonia emersonii CBS 393.64]
RAECRRLQRQHQHGPVGALRQHVQCAPGPDAGEHSRPGALFDAAAVQHGAGPEERAKGSGRFLLRVDGEQRARDGVPSPAFFRVHSAVVSLLTGG